MAVKVTRRAVRDLHGEAVRLLAENAALKGQVKWFRKMMRRARALIVETYDMGTVADRFSLAYWLDEYHREMRRKREE